MPRKWYEAEIISKNEISPTTRVFRVRIDEEDPFMFTAGQFITMDLPIAEKRLDRWRSYSIANTPNEENILEFCIVRTQPGHATKYLFEDTQIGDTIRFKGPQGVFCLPSNLNRDLIFICTGTGIAPFRSMLKQIKEEKLSFQNIDLYFGTRHKEGILYKEEMENFEKEYPNFKFHVALSREKYQNYTGYVHDLYRQNLTNKDNPLFYLCGWQNMVDEASKNLVNLGFEKAQIITELYG